jgi:hypothetical protein
MGEKITGNDLIAKLKEIEACCDSVWRTLERHSDPGSIVFGSLGGTKITGNHVIATEKDIETCCKAVRQALEQHPGLGSVVFDLDPGKMDSPNAFMAPGTRCGPIMLAPGACFPKLKKPPGR